MLPVLVELLIAGAVRVLLVRVWVPVKVAAVDDAALASICVCTAEVTPSR
jgi:hypothetical protein